MGKYIDAEKLIAEIERLAETLPEVRSTMEGLLSLIDFLQQEQPDNEDIDKVAQELYEHLYELKRRNNVPTNLYDKQEIIDLWKAGIEYGRNHPKQEQPDGNLEYWLEHFGMPKENIDYCITQIAQGYGACRYLEGVQHGAEAVNELARQEEQPEVDLEKEIHRFFEECIEVHEVPLYGKVKERVISVDCYEITAYHFYSLGLNAKKG